MGTAGAGRGFDVRTVVLAAGARRAYDASEWQDALVVVIGGEVELEFAGGARRRFARGAVLWLARLSLRALHNPHASAACLLAVSRARPARR